GETRSVYFGPHGSRNRPLAAFAPNFTAFDAAGRKVRLSDFRGSFVVLDLLPPPAPGDPAKAFSSYFDFLPFLNATNQVVDRLNSKRVVSLVLVQRDSAPNAVRVFRSAVAAQRAALPRVRFLREAAEYFSPAYPQRFVIGPDGTIRHHYSDDGPASLSVFKDEARLERALRSALKR
ncbi:MAG: hypothetical protein V4671_03620, partial [Armatimonadota bacterium]